MNNPAQLIVIPGFEKCWTTSITGLLINNKLGQLLTPRVKEPHIFSAHDFSGLSITAGLPVIDASQSYVNNPAALEKLKPYQPKLILLYRNPYDRAFSAYKMYKLLFSQEQQHIETMKTLLYSKNFGLKPPIAKSQRDEFHIIYRDILGEEYYSKTRHYLDLEIERIRSMSFLERLSFEQAFFQEKGYFPYLSILLNSLFCRSTAFVLERFNAKDILPITVHARLNSDLLLSKLATFVDMPIPASPIPLQNDFDITGEFKFEDASFNAPDSRKIFADFFRHDIIKLGESLESHQCDLSLFNTQYLME